MSEEKEKNNEIVSQPATEPGYIEALLKKNAELEATIQNQSSEYNRLVADNQALVNNILNGEKVSASEPAIDVEEVRERLATGKCKTNLEVMESLLILRDADIAAGLPDPMMNRGPKYEYDYNDEVNTLRAIEGLRHCIEMANGDPEQFNLELKKITADSSTTVNNKPIKKRR